MMEQHNTMMVKWVLHISQEFQFAKYCERLQKQLIRQLDREFKRYPVHRGIDIENSTFSLEFTPNNFSSYRELDLDNQRNIV